MPTSSSPKFERVHSFSTDFRRASRSLEILVVVHLLTLHSSDPISREKIVTFFPHRVASGVAGRCTDLSHLGWLHSRKGPRNPGYRITEAALSRSVGDLPGLRVVAPDEPSLTDRMFLDLWASCRFPTLEEVLSTLDLSGPPTPTVNAVSKARTLADDPAQKVTSLGFLPGVANSVFQFGSLNLTSDYALS